MNAAYDAVLVGQGLGPAVAAALLAKSGKRVFLVEDGARSEWSTDSIAAPLDGAEVLMGLQEGFAFKKILDLLGVGDEIFEMVESADELAQIVHPRFRVSIDRQPEKLRNELLKEFSTNESEQLLGYLMSLQSVGNSLSRYIADVLGAAQVSRGKDSEQRKEYGRILKKFSAVMRQSAGYNYSSQQGSTALSIDELLVPIVAFNSYASPHNLNVEQCVRACSLAFGGLWRAKNGICDLILRLEKIIQDHGGVVKKQASVESFVVDKGQIKGVLLNSYEGVVYAPYVVLGARHMEIYTTIGSDHQDRNLKYDLSRVEASHWRYSMRLYVNKDGLPESFGSNVVFITDPTLPLEEENYIMVRTLNHETEPDRVSLLVTVLVPYTSARLDYKHLRRLSGRVLRRLESFVPFIDFNIISMTPDFRKNEDAIREHYPEDQMYRIPERLHQYYVRGAKEAQAFEAVGVATSHANLYFCGRIIWPALGTYGEVLSAWKVYEALTAGG
jgi:phytoene dehydrogenase-like protein